jgi:hypothetical protein
MASFRAALNFLEGLLGRYSSRMGVRLLRPKKAYSLAPVSEKYSM